MAKVGLNFGEKMLLAGKRYRVLNDGLVPIKEILGQLTFGKVEQQILAYEDDTSRPRQADGTYPQIPTGEILGLEISVKSSVQQGTLFVTLLEQSQDEIEALGLAYREDVELKDVIITYSSVRDNQFKLFASSIVKKSTTPSINPGSAETSKAGDKPGKDQK